MLDNGSVDCCTCLFHNKNNSEVCSINGTEITDFSTPDNNNEAPVK